MHDDHIDRAIDDVARELTAGEPATAFRARVMARLERGGSRRRWPAWLMTPLPIAAMILIALAAAWSYRSPERLALHPGETRALHPGETLALRPVEKTAIRPGEKILQPAAARLARPTSPDPARARITTRSDVAALAPTPLGVPSIALARIDRGESIQLQQLEPIAPIDVAPLDPSGTENREPGNQGVRP
jgi:hypothetical protein